MVLDDPSDSVELACKELTEQLPNLSPDEASALLTKRLRLVLMNHIDQSVDHARTLLSVRRPCVICFFSVWGWEGEWGGRGENGVEGGG